MAYLYVLQSSVKKWFYIGSTKDLKSRIKEHNALKVKSSKAYAPFKLRYYEAYSNYSLARKRELELKKNGQQKEILFKRLEIIGEV